MALAVPLNCPRRVVLNNSSHYNDIEHTYEIYTRDVSIYYLKTTSTTCRVSHENLSSCMNEVVSQVLTKEGGGQEIDFKMDADHK